MNLKELIQKANQLVHEEGHTLHELLEKNEFPSHVDDIIQLIQFNENLIDTPSPEDYLGLQKALEKRREVSLKATFAAVSHLLLPDRFPLKSLDNFKSNLQSEKKPTKGSSMPESEELSQEDIEALLAGNLSDNKGKKASKADDQLSNDDIEALLAGVGPTTKSDKKENTSKSDFENILSEVNNTPKMSAKAKKEAEEFSQEDIESLLAGEPTKSSAIKPDEVELSAEELNSMLGGGAAVGEESDQISEDDIKSLLEAQDEQDKVNPLAKALNSDKEPIAVTAKATGNTDRVSSKVIPQESFKPKEEILVEETNMPEEIFPTEKSFEDLIMEKDLDSAIETLKADLPKEVEKEVVKPFTPSQEPRKPTLTNESVENQMQSGDIKERVLSDVYALYVNKNGKPILHAECPTRDEIKKAYLLAMQDYPQNSLFIEKISRREIIVIKETKEIINLKVNISFD